MHLNHAIIASIIILVSSLLHIVILQDRGIYFRIKDGLTWKEALAEWWGALERSEIAAYIGCFAFGVLLTTLMCHDFGHCRSKSTLDPVTHIRTTVETCSCGQDP